MEKSEKNIEFMKLYEPVHQRLTRFCRAISRNNDEAKDLISQTVLTAYESFEKLNNPIAFTSYLFTIASRIHKKTKFRKRIFSGIDENAIEQISSAESLPDNLYDIEQLYKAIRTLPEKQAQAIVLFEISGYSIEEIRAIQGGTLSGVKSRLKRARERLKELLTDNIPEENIITDKSNNNSISKTNKSLTYNIDYNDELSTKVNYE